jgi:hypothetical protein
MPDSRNSHCGYTERYAPIVGDNTILKEVKLLLGDGTATPAFILPSKGDLPHPYLDRP